MSRLLAALVWAALFTTASAETLYGFAQGERLEYRVEPETVLWDLQGRYGGDYHRLWWKTEGELDDGSSEYAELQLLYSRAWTAYFDLQFGLRYADYDLDDKSSIVAGLQGMAPYRFEIDAALFLSEDGDLSIRAEFERDILLTQKFILQPRAEINLAFSDVPDIGIGSGVNELAVDLRFRYEYTRKLAPYAGVSWQRSFGDTADYLRAVGKDSSETTLVAGVRFWF